MASLAEDGWFDVPCADSALGPAKISRDVIELENGHMTLLEPLQADSR